MSKAMSDTLHTSQPSKKIHGVFFDLDGTLMDTAYDLAAALNLLLAENQSPPLPRTVIEKQVSYGVAGLLQLGFAIGEKDTDYTKLKQRFLDIHLELLTRQCTTPLYPDLDRLLDTLEQRGIFWGIVTNKSRQLAEVLLDWHNLTDRCSVLVCPEDVRAIKPSPESLLLASKTIRCNPEHCLYIGDHERDIIAGKCAGMTTVAATYGYIAPHVSPAQWQAAFDARRPGDILAWLTDNQWQLPNRVSDKKNTGHTGSFS